MNKSRTHFSLSLSPLPPPLPPFSPLSFSTLLFLLSLLALPTFPFSFLPPLLSLSLLPSLLPPSLLSSPSLTSLFLSLSFLEGGRRGKGGGGGRSDGGLERGKREEEEKEEKEGERKEMERKSAPLPPFLGNVTERGVVRVFITSFTAIPVTKLFAWEGDSGGHVLRETTSRGLCGLVYPSRTSEHGGEGDCVKEGRGEEGERERERVLGVRLRHSRRVDVEVNPQRRRFGRRESDVCVCLLLQYLLQRCSRGRRDSGGHVLRATKSRDLCGGTREEPGTLTQGAPVFPGSSRLEIEPKTPGWLTQDRTTRPWRSGVFGLHSSLDFTLSPPGCDSVCVFISAVQVSRCVLITAVPFTNLFAWGGGVCAAFTTAVPITKLGT